MNRTIAQIEQKHRKTTIPTGFHVGDLVDVHVQIREGDKERVQVFSGTVIQIRGGGKNLRSTFTVRRIVSGEGVERIFPFHSPRIVKVKVKRPGKVRRATLYYLRERVGKATKVKERRVDATATGAGERSSAPAAETVITNPSPRSGGVRSGQGRGASASPPGTSAGAGSASSGATSVNVPASSTSSPSMAPPSSSSKSRPAPPPAAATASTVSTPASAAACAPRARRTSGAVACRRRAGGSTWWWSSTPSPRAAAGASRGSTGIPRRWSWSDGFACTFRFPCAFPYTFPSPCPCPYPPFDYDYEHEHEHEHEYQDGRHGAAAGATE
jgi:large subunit ribosomal protein L19